MGYRFIHIPKTGGSTFKVNLINAKQFFPMDHLTCYDEKDKNIVILRNPIDQVISRYKSQTETTNETFEQWFDDKAYNMQTKHLKLRLLKKDPTFKYLCPIDEKEVKEIHKILKKFYYVMLTERLSKQMPYLLKKMKIKVTEKRCNVSKKKYKPTNEEKEIIKEKCSMDFILYNLWKKSVRTVVK